MIGKALGRYQVLEKLGAGGMGEVYRARDTRRPVAGLFPAGEVEKVQVIGGATITLCDRTLADGATWGVMNEVGGRLLTIFASNLATLLAGQEGAPAAASPAAASPAAASPEAAGPEGAAASAVDKPIDDLKLPPRAASSLRREGITTVGQLATKTEAELLAIDGIGPASVEEIKAKLTGLGLTPGQPLPVAAAPPAEAAPTPAAPTPAAPTAVGPNAVGPSAAAVTQASDGATAPAAAAVAPQHPSTTREFVHKAEDDAINLLRVAGVPVLKRAIPVLAGLVAALLIGLRRKAARRRTR